MSQSEDLKELLESDYKFVLISGDYFDCPSCNPSTSFQADTFFDEDHLLKHMVERAGSDRMEAIWILDCWNTGNMIKFCDIDTRTGGHKVYKMEFDLPSGHYMIEYDQGGYKLASPAKTVLQGNNK